MAKGSNTALSRPLWAEHSRENVRGSIRLVGADVEMRDEPNSARIHAEMKTPSRSAAATTRPR